MSFQYKIQHLRLCPYVMTVEHIDELLHSFQEMGFNAVMIEYENVFPYHSLPELDSQYSLEDIARINSCAKDCGLEIIPKGVSFSHARYITKLDRFKQLKDGNDALNLLRQETFELVRDAVEDVIKAHPNTKIVHLGGDEIFNFPCEPDSNNYALIHGISKLYVQFVNKLVACFSEWGVRIAIWSDMLIRYPEAACELDKSVIIFYWNYWSNSERVNYLSIGGGMPDTFVLDRDGIVGDLEKMYRVSIVKEKTELPIGHLKYFKDYWQLDSDESSCNGFPYLKWFRDLGLNVVASMLTYPEKGAFLPNMGEKVGHVRSFLKVAKSNSSLGFMTCCWQENWPLVENLLPSLCFAMEANHNTTCTNDEIYDKVARKMTPNWNASLLKEYFNITRHFEFSDVLNPFWQLTPICDRITWLDKAGWLMDDMKRTLTVKNNAEAFLKKVVNEKNESYENFLVEDIKWRAECQLACGKMIRCEKEQLVKKGEYIMKWAKTFFHHWYTESSVDALLKIRYIQWFEAIEQLVE